jgi:DNA-binding NarL/FixJ family response regulator
VVAEAADGTEAIRLARQLRPDVCLIDIRMPRLDGIDVTRALAGPGIADPLRVVIVTTFAGGPSQAGGWGDPRPPRDGA